MDPIELQERLHRHLEVLSVPRNSVAHPDAHLSTLEYLATELKSYGREVERQPFESRGLGGVNIVSPPASSDTPSFLLVAHHDTVDGSPGADDNGSAVAVALELARLCPKVAFLFPDLEERDLLGSRHWMDPPRWESTPVLVLESVGFWSTAAGSQSYPPLLPLAFPTQFGALREREFRGDFWALLYLTEQRNLAQDLSNQLEQDVFEFELALEQVQHLKDFGRSDHLAFWEKGRPCLMLTDSANFRNPHYHLPSDTPATLDLELMTSLTANLMKFLRRDPTRLEKPTR